MPAPPSPPPSELFPGSAFVRGPQLPLTDILRRSGIDLVRDSPVKVDDLRTEHHALLSAHGDLFRDLQGLPIAPGDDRTTDSCLPPYNLPLRHGRSLFAHPGPGLVWGIKGNGERGWRTGKVLLTDGVGGARRAPITVNEKPMSDAFRFFGGLVLESACREMVAGLALRALCRKDGIDPATVGPLAVQRIEELPWDEAGTVSVHSAGEHGTGFRFVGELPLLMPAVHSLAAEDLAQLGAYHYVGAAVHARIPEYQLVPDPERGPSAPTKERSVRYMYAGLDFALPWREREARHLATRIGGVLRTAHAHGLSFSLDPDDVRRMTGHPLVATQFSALHPSNVSVAGEICDLETVRAEFLGDRVTERMRQQDIDNAFDTVQRWGSALDLPPAHHLDRAAEEELQRAAGAGIRR